MDNQRYTLQQVGDFLLGSVPPERIFDVRQDAGTLFVRYDRSLLCVEWRTPANRWTIVHRENEFFVADDVPGNYPWTVSSGGLVMVRKSEGFLIYRYDSGRLTRLATSSVYHDMYNYNDPTATILVGNFYANPRYIGVLTRRNGVVEFAVTGSDMVTSVQPIWPVSGGSAVDGSWLEPSTSITLAQGIDERDQEVILVRMTSALRIYRFMEQQRLIFLASVDGLRLPEDGYDQLLFAKFSSNSYKDLLHFAPSGLVVYRYADNSKAYEKLHYTATFSEWNGWTRTMIDALTIADFNGDGVDEIVGTGPTGFCVFRIASSQERFELENAYEGTAEVSRFRYGIPKLTATDSILMLTRDGLAKVTIAAHDMPATPEEEPVTPEPEVAPIVGSPLIIPQSRYTRWLHDQLDLGNLLQPLNPITGTVELTLPLIELGSAFGVSVSKALRYKEVNYNAELGRGWSLPLDYITVDTGDSFFKRDFVYSIVRDNHQVMLRRKPANDTDASVAFTVSGFEEMDIRFKESDSQWEVSIKNRKLLYGSYNDMRAVVSKSVCKTWPLCGENKGDMMDMPTTWYLLREEDASGSFATYSYDIKDTGIVRLIGIQLNDGTSSASFLYDDGVLKSFRLQTEHYEQNVSFQYANQLLIVIAQDSQPLFKFEYGTDPSLMTKLTYPNGLETTFEYSRMQNDASRFQQSIRTGSEPGVYYGSDYLVIGDQDSHVLTLNIRDPLGGSNTKKATSTPISLEVKDLQGYLVYPLETLIAIVLTFEQSKQIRVLHFTGDQWHQSAQYSKLPLESIVTCGQDFVLLKDATNLRLMTADGGKFIDKVLKTSLTERFVVHALSQGYATYDDTQLEVHVRQDDGSWHPNVIPVSKTFSGGIENFVAQFNIDDELKKNMVAGFRVDMLQNYRNAIVLRTPVLVENGTVSVHLMLIIVDSTGALQNAEVTSVQVADFSTFTLPLTVGKYLNFTLAYRMAKNGKYDLIIANDSIEQERQRLLKEVEKVEASNAEKEKLREYIKAELEKDYQTAREKVLKTVPFALDLSQFGVLISPTGILTANKMLTYDGKAWQKDAVDHDELRLLKVDRVLGDQFRLKKQDKDDTFKLYTQDGSQLLFDTQTSSTNETMFVLPRYILSQKQGKPVTMYTVGPKRTLTLDPSEAMHGSSNNYALVTTDTYNSRIIIRPAQAFVQPEMFALKRQTVQLSETERRVTEYVFAEDSIDNTGESTIFTRVKIVPGGDATRFGWYEQAFDLVTGAATKKVFSGDARMIEEHREPEKQPTKPRDDERIIWDRSRMVEIADLGPYRVSDEVVSYYGFEDYEANRIGTDKQWQFDAASVVTEHENSFLRLTGTGNGQLSGSFQPTTIGREFVVSCWLRMDSIPSLEDTVDVLKVDVTGPSLKVTVNSAKVAQILGDGWCYIETVIDCIEHSQNAQEFQFLVTISPSKTSGAIDIDHVRFSPLDANLKINIYSTGRSSSEPRAILSSNGLIKQSFYNAQGKRTIHMAESGQITDFAMHSKVCYAQLIDARSSVIEMKPAYSVYHNFDSATRALWATESDSWALQEGTMSYDGQTKGIISRTFDDHLEVVVIRFLLNIRSKDAHLAMSWRGQQHKLLCRGDSCDYPFDDGEFLIFLTPKRISIWLDGVLIEETQLAATESHVFQLIAEGSLELRELIELYEPQVKITYHNRLGLPEQLIALIDSDTVRMMEIIYDEVDRAIMRTKWTKLSSAENENQMFAFRENFVTAIDASYKMDGLIATLNPACEGYAYSRTVYANEPNESRSLQGLPGKDYTVDGNYKRQFSHRSDILLLETLFPEAKGFKQEVEIRPGAAVRVTVKDAQDRKVASYVKVGSYSNRLTTYRYNANGKLVLELPPLYHSAVRTFERERPLDHDQLNEQERTALEKWAVQYRYDDGNLLTWKRSPDAGIVEYLYSRDGILRFAIHSDLSGRVDRAVHFSYSVNGKVTREALVDLGREECKALVESDQLPSTANAIETSYGELDSNPSIRHRVQQSTRRIADEQNMEIIVYNEHDQVAKKMFVVPSANTTFSVDYRYRNGKLHSIKYPVGEGEEGFQLIYRYNNLGKVVSIKDAAIKRNLFEFDYNADGLLETMKNDHVSRRYGYNEPGFLVRISDEYSAEQISYRESDSYGKDSFIPLFEGLITRTVFTANWLKQIDPVRTAILPEHLEGDHMNTAHAKLCIKSLRSHGYLDGENRISKKFYVGAEVNLPAICDTNHVAQVLTSKGFPQQYGHAYDYDDHDQLIKAKYFHSPTDGYTGPLTEGTLVTEIPSLDRSSATTVWNILKSKGYLVLDCANPSICHGRPGKSLFSSFVEQHQYSANLKRLLSDAIAKRKTISSYSFQPVCVKWFDGASETTTAQISTNCCEIWNQLLNRKLVGLHSEKTLTALDVDLRTALHEYSHQLPDIIGTLGKYFLGALGKSAGDLQSYGIDANGNHRLFYNGFTRWRLEYQDGSNQVSKVYKTMIGSNTTKEEEFEMAHNSDGAVTRAMHKGIKQIQYDQLLGRASKIELVDGRTVLFQYDVRGERTFKQVLDPEGSVLYEKYYIRDLKGNVLVDLELAYLTANDPPDARVTSYVYTDQGLVGFIRNDQLYTVLKDHEGSVRLVVADGVVVAAYDYLPYGHVFRKYGHERDGLLSYLYTGQEWDEEFGLYNYHARFYDPDIGRFYQVDPKDQYPSPYVYAGNSPVALVDPDGEFAFALACIILGLLGAYLGGATANRNWNPAQWDWRAKETYLGIFGGGLQGLSIPFNMVSSVGYFIGLGLSMNTAISVMVGTGISFAYFSLAATSGSWNPADFDFSAPGAWFAMLSGVSTGAWIVRNPSSLFTAYTTLTSTVGQSIFLTSKISLSIGFAYLNAVMSQDGEFDITKWDYSDPKLYFELLEGFTVATTGVVFARNLPKNLRLLNGKLNKMLDILAETEVFYKTQKVLGGQWSNKLFVAKYFVTANKVGIKQLSAGMLTGGFFAFIVSLRLAKATESSKVPVMPSAQTVINAVFTTRGFSNHLVKRVLYTSPDHLILGRSLDIRDTGADVTVASSSGTWSAIPDILSLITIPRKQHAMDNRQDSHDQQDKQDRTKTLNNCYRVLDTQNEQQESYIKCYAERSVVSIYPTHEALIGTADNYTHCYPVTHNHVPSISCEGEKSTMIGVNYSQTTVFDYVDGWLLLARIAPAIYQDLKRSVSYLWSGARGDNPKPSLKTGRKAQIEQMLTPKLAHLHSLVDKCDSKQTRKLVIDLEEDIDEFIKHGTGSFELLEERILALQEEVVEEHDTVHRTAFFGSLSNYNDELTRVEAHGESLVSSGTNFSHPQLVAHANTLRLIGKEHN